MNRALAALLLVSISLPAWAQEAEETPPQTPDDELSDFLDSLRLDCEGEECDRDNAPPPSDEEAEAEDAAETVEQAETQATAQAEPDETPALEDDASPAPAAPADTAASTLSPATPLLDSTAYLEARGDNLSEVLELVWSIDVISPSGEPLGESRTRRLFMAPDFVRDESSAETHLYDFFAGRHLQIDAEAGTYRNLAFEADVRRRLDTYLGLSRQGTLDIIPLGPDTGFERFWLEAAMGLRRAPVDLDYTYADATLSVHRDGDGEILSARFEVPDLPEANESDPQDNPLEDSSETTPDVDGITLADAASPVDLENGESVVFDPTRGAAPITLDFDSGANPVDYPDSLPATQAQAELFRRWMRHALPIHPDALSRLRGAPSIPVEFSYFVVSPESPEGRLEVWTLVSSDVREPGFRLEPDLAVTPPGPDLLSDIILPAAVEASTARPPTEGVMMDIIADFRARRDFARAYLTAFQEISHKGPCPPPGPNSQRPICDETAAIIASGLGNSAFETVFGAVNLIGGGSGERILEALEPYLAEETLAGAAARTIVANELLAWASRDPEGAPEDVDPYRLIAEAIAIDPYALANYRYFGNAMLTLRNPVSAWAAFDAARSVPHSAPSPFIAQLDDLDRRLRTLAPEFFLPR
ncbi:hypothetical protein [Hyphobacterium sp.]|uniref:hypothetical protein n=1 Tax=Hyphobacterium sp. TaxID=2004662 RepID=UPI003BACFE07